jgi:translocation and assembly module TamB
LTETEPDTAAAPPKPKQGPQAHHYVAGVLGVLAVLILAVIAAVRFAVLTDPGRNFVVRHVDGLGLGSLGKLRVSGLQGDLWSEFTLDRLSIVDSQGAWLDLRKAHVRWTPEDLLTRRVHIELLVVEQTTLGHRPSFGGGPPAAPSLKPVAVSIERLHTRLETLPAFSVERGLFMIDGGIDQERDGGLAGAVYSKNLSHPGDGLRASFDLGIGKKVRLDALAHESRGGALAGILGLPTAKAVNLYAKADGDVAAGQLTLMATSGDTAIAQADGAWSKQGGDVKGWLSLAASTLTSGYQARLGPTLQFSLHQAAAKGEVQPVAAHLQADYASLDLAGPVNLAKHRSDQGVSIQLRIKDVSKWLATPAIGPGRLEGTLKGGIGDAELAAQVAVQNLAFAGYNLGAASGPAHLTWRHGEWRLMATADGAGGQGGGIIGALAGARPHASVDISRLPDGRFLMRDLKAEGAGLSVAATGAKGLFGDLNFKGQSRLTNLAALRTGAKGTVDLKWSAGQARAREPWKFDLQADGTAVQTGDEQLDRLLGGKPHLTATAALDDGALNFSKANLIGAAAQASGSGTVAIKDWALKLAVAAGADGPLQLGPAALSGKTRVSGTVTGTFGAPRADLVADADQMNLLELKLAADHLILNVQSAPTGINGVFNLTAADAQGAAHARAVFRLADGGVALENLDATAGGASAQGAVSLRQSAVTSADLNVALGPGAFAAQGRAEAHLKVADRGGAPAASLSLTATNLLLKGATSLIQSVNLKADGPLSALPYTVQAQIQGDQAPLSLKGGGEASHSDKGYVVGFSGSGRFRQTDFHTLSPARITLLGEDRNARLNLALGGGQAQIQADENGPSLAVKAELTGIDLSTLGEDIAGHVDADLILQGQGDHLDGRMQAHLKNARSSDAPMKLALNGAVNASLADAHLTLDAQVDGVSANNHAQVHVVLPALASAAPFRLAVDRTRPISGDFALSGELQPVWDLFFGDGRELGGQLIAKGSLGGALEHPQVTGHGDLAHGRFEDASTGLKLREVSASVDLQGEALTVEHFTASDAHTGSLSGQGRLEVGPNGASTLTLKAKGFQLLDNELAKATASGQVTVVREANGQAKLSGDLTIDRADISAESSRTPPGVVVMDVVERNKPYVPSKGLQAQAGTGPAIDLDVKIKAPGRIYVKGLGLDAELSLDAHVGGATSAPVLEGAANIVRGDYDFAGKRFTIDDRGVVYLATTPDKIRLDLTATQEVPSLTAIIRIQGTAAKPQITLTSTPTLPDDEVLSQVLFGQSAAQLSPVEAAQLAAALTTLATGGGFDVMGGLKNFARLDRLALGGGDAATGVTVSGGKYIGSRVYLELTGGGRQGASAQVEIKATKALSVISQVGGEFGAKLSVRWRKDYGRAKPAVK